MATRDSTRGWWIPLPFLVAALVIGIRGTASQVGQPRRAVTPVRSEGAWESIQVALGDGFSLRLRYRKQASPDMARWLEFEVDNRTGKPLLIRTLEFRVDYDIPDESSACLVSGGSQDLLPHDTVSGRADRSFRLPPGRTRLQGALSAKAAARLPLARGKAVRLLLQCGTKLDTERGRAAHGDMRPTVELRWRRPSKPALAAMRRQLKEALEDPDAAVARGYDIGAWIQKPAISEHLNPRRLLAGLSRCEIESSARFAILSHLAVVYGRHPDVRAHYLERLRGGDEAALEELRQSASRSSAVVWAWRSRPAGARRPTSKALNPPALWSPAFVTPVVRLMEKTPRAWHSGFRLLERHGAPQARDPALAARLGAALRKADVLAPVRNRDRGELPSYFEAFRLIAMTRDPGMIPMLVERLNDRTVRDELRGYPEHWSFIDQPDGPPGGKRPPLRRGCDAALEALLQLRGADVAKRYEVAGWSVENHRAIGRPKDSSKSWLRHGMPEEMRRKIDAERGRWLDALRDRIIKDLREEMGR